MADNNILIIGYKLGKDKGDDKYDDTKVVITFIFIFIDNGACKR